MRRLALPALAAVVSLAAASPSTARERVVYLTATVPIKPQVVVETREPITANPNDPDRCAAAVFARWPRVKRAYYYEVRMDPPPENTRSHSVDLDDTDNAPYTYDRFGAVGPFGRGRGTYNNDLGYWRNPLPNRRFTLHGFPPFTWPAGEVRGTQPIGWGSTGEGCEKAREGGEAGGGKFIVGVAKAYVSHRVRVKRTTKKDAAEARDELERSVPKGAVVVVDEISRGGAVWVWKRGKKRRLRVGDGLKPGDVITTSCGGKVALQSVTAGRIGIAGDRNVLILDGGDVKDLTVDSPAQQTTNAVKAWRRIFGKDNYWTHQRPEEEFTPLGCNREVGIKG